MPRNEVHENALNAFRHNGLHGTCERVAKMLETIATAPSVTDETTQLCAALIDRVRGDLKRSLQTRVN